MVQGNRTPFTDPLSRGALAGLTLKHTKAHIFRALAESVCFGTELIFEAQRKSGYSPTSITIAGGVTKSPLWLQITADVTNIPLRLTRSGKRTSVLIRLLSFTLDLPKLWHVLLSAKVAPPLSAQVLRCSCSWMCGAGSSGSRSISRCSDCGGSDGLCGECRAAERREAPAVQGGPPAL